MNSFDQVIHEKSMPLMKIYASLVRRGTHLDVFEASISNTGQEFVTSLHTL